MEFIQGIAIFAALIYLGYMIDKRLEVARKEHEATRELLCKLTDELKSQLSQIDYRSKRLSRLVGDE